MNTIRNGNGWFQTRLVTLTRIFVAAGNKAKRLKQNVAGLLVFSLIGCVMGRAQETTDAFSSINLSGLSDNGVLELSGTNISSFKTFTDGELSALLDVLDATPTLPLATLPRDGMGGTYWSLQNPSYPPLPGDTIGVNVWPMEDGSFLLNDVNYDYNNAPPVQLAVSKVAATGFKTRVVTAKDSPPVPGGGGGTNTYSPNDVTNTPTDYGTNLWIASPSVSAGLLAGFGSNTLADVEYEIQSRTNLVQSDWQTEGYIYGSELTNWSPLSVAQNGRTNLFLRLKSWISSDGSGIPDWWEQQYGLTNIDPNGPDSAGDGWTISQKYQMGLNPNVFYTPPAPSGFSVFYNSRNGTVSLNWQPSLGNVTNYTVSRYNPNTERNTQFNLPSSATNLVDSSPITVFPPENGEPTYTLQARYSQGNSAVETLTMFNHGTTVPAQIVLGSQGQNELVVPGPIPSGTTALLLTRSDLNQDTYSYTESTFSLSLSSLSNNTAVLPAAWFNSSSLPDDTEDWYAQTVGNNGSESDMTQAGDSLYWEQGLPSPVLFFDGRQQMAQNATFLLRVANAGNPLSYSYVSGGIPIYTYNYPYNYSYAGLYDVSKINGPYNNPPPPYLNTFRPFSENYFFHNFVFSPGDLDPTTGQLTTGIGWGFYNGLYTSISGNPTYSFIAGTNTTIPAILDPTQTTWTCFYPLSEQPDIPNNPPSVSYYGVSGSGGDYSMPTTGSNSFGLAFLSARFAYTNGTLQTPILEAGGTISGVADGGFFSQTAIPQLKTVDYYFAQPASYPLPGQDAFSTDLPNNTNNLVAGFGQSTLFAGYAKQVLLNGFTNVYSYLGQYFDQAYQIGANGNVTTNSAGVISPYGEFVATAVGPVALVTMTNWGENVRGTGIVQVVKLVLDVNHDGVMDLSVNGPDNTSPNNQYVFWCNNNFDRWHQIDFGTDNEQDDLPTQYGYGPSGSFPMPDCNYTVGGQRMIPCVRDLEDFARLWICGMTTNLLAALPAGSTITLSWGDVGNPNTNNPTIDLFTAADAAGGIGYQTNETVATLQTNAIQCPYFGRLGPGQSIPLSSFDTNGNPTWIGNYFIWCGVSNGTGGLTLTIWDGNSNILAQTTTYIQIKDIKQMYERWTVGDDGNVAPGLVAEKAMNDLPTNSTTAPEPFIYGPPQNTNTPYILFVHGWNMPAWEKDRYAETAFKRLYWQGYQGRFGEFRWPTFAGFPLNEFSWEAFNPRNYDNSESNAWASAVGLLNKLNDLNVEYPGQVYLMAHSMGNVVAGEALRLAGTNRVVNTYIAMQAALPAHAYDPNTPTRNYSFITPDNYADYWTNGASCYFSGSAGAGAYINYFNTNDYALAWWNVGQNGKPDHGVVYPGYFYSISGLHPNGYYVQFGSNTNDFQNLNFPGDTYSIFAYCDQSWSYALGAQANVNGKFAGNHVELDVLPYGFGTQHKYHSGEFRSDDAQRWQFWDSVLVDFQLKNP